MAGSFQGLPYFYFGNLGELGNLGEFGNLRVLGELGNFLIVLLF